MTRRNPAEQMRRLIGVLVGALFLIPALGGTVGAADETQVQVMIQDIPVASYSASADADVVCHDHWWGTEMHSEYSASASATKDPGAEKHAEGDGTNLASRSENAGGLEGPASVSDSDVRSADDGDFAKAEASAWAKDATGTKQATASDSADDTC